MGLPAWGLWLLNKPSSGGSQRQDTMYRIPLSIPVGNQDQHKGATTKPTVSDGPSHDILVQVGHSRLAWLREVSIYHVSCTAFWKQILKTKRPQLAGSAVDESTNYHYHGNCPEHIAIEGWISWPTTPYTVTSSWEPWHSTGRRFGLMCNWCATDCCESRRNTVSIIHTDCSVSQISGTCKWKHRAIKVDAQPSLTAWYPSITTTMYQM